MVTEQDQIKVLDFGLATLAGRRPDQRRRRDGARAAAVETGAGTILGTVAYMSPEQAEGTQVDARSDIFSFGAILYEMLSGLRAFRAGSTPRTLAAVINLEPEPLAKVAQPRAAGGRRLVGTVPAQGRQPARAAARRTSRSTLDGLREASISGSLRAAPRRAPRPVVALRRASPRSARRPWSPPHRAVAGAAAADGRSRPSPLTSLPGSESFPTLLAGRQPGRVHLAARRRHRHRRLRPDHRRRHAAAPDRRRRLAHVSVVVARRHGDRALARAARHLDRRR